MNDDEPKKYQELNDEDLGKVSGGAYVAEDAFFICKKCGNVDRLFGGGPIPQQCPKCGNADIRVSFY